MGAGLSTRNWLRLLPNARRRLQPRRREAPDHVADLLLRVGPDVTWWRDVAPGLTVFGLGLALMVAPLTATVLAAAPDEVAGVASGINNALARAGSLLAVAALPMAVGLAGDDYRDPALFDTAYGSAVLACAGLLVVGGLVSWFTIPHRVQTTTA